MPNRMQEKFQAEMMKTIANMSTPETRDDLTPDENRVIKLSCEGGRRGGPQLDAHFAEQLDQLLTAAAGKGIPINCNVMSSSGSPPLVMASISNGVQRIKVLLKHGADPNIPNRDYQETGLHIAARYGFVEVLQVLLKGGANPLLLDYTGTSPLDLAKADTPGFSATSGPKPKQELTALLKEHTAKYQNHLRTRTKKGAATTTTTTASTASSSSSSKPAAAAAAPSAAAAAAALAAAAGGGPEYSSKSCDTCGKEDAEGSKLLKCSRCKLRAYCCKDCQVEDWPTHKAPCRMVSDVKAKAAELMDPSLDDDTRMIRANMFGERQR